MKRRFIQTLRQKSYVIALSATMAFFVPVIAQAETIRQPAGTPHDVVAGATQANNMAFTAPINGYIYSEAWYASANIGDWVASAANTLICDYDGVSITNCVAPSNSVTIATESWYPFDFSANPKQIIKGHQYVALFEPRPVSSYANGTVLGDIWGTDATSTVFFGTSGTTTAFCIAKAGLIDCAPNMVQATWFITTTPLNLPITTLFPNATSTATDLPTAQSFCGSATFATSTGFLDSAGQAFGRGICLAFAYVFVPSSSSLNQWQGIPDLMSAHIPFSYAFGIKDAFSGLTASTTDNLTGVTYTLPNIGSTSPIGTLYPTTIVGLSTSTIGTYLPESARQSFLGLQRVAIWLILAMVIYRRIIPHHVITKHT